MGFVSWLKPKILLWNEHHEHWSKFSEGRRSRAQWLLDLTLEPTKNGQARGDMVAIGVSKHVPSGKLT